MPTERLQKFLSRSGIASRRKAEELIDTGQVFVNEKQATLGDKIDPANDVIKVSGKIIQGNIEKIYLILNKPRRVVVSKSDEWGRRTVFDLLPSHLKNQVWAIGRLDFDTEGLLILTNDGDLTQELAHPKYRHEKEYEVTTEEIPDAQQLNKLRQGVKIPTGLTHPAQVKLENGKTYITLHEGKKRQIRHMFHAVELNLLKLKRIRINKLSLPTDLEFGAFRAIKKEDVLSV